MHDNWRRGEPQFLNETQLTEEERFAEIMMHVKQMAHHSEVSSMSVDVGKQRIGIRWHDGKAAELIVVFK